MASTKVLPATTTAPISTDEGSSNNDTFYEDMQYNFGQSGLRKLGYKAGIKRKTTDYDKALIEFSYKFLDQIVKDSVIVAEHNKRRTMYVSDVKLAAKKNNCTLFY